MTKIIIYNKNILTIIQKYCIEFCTVDGKLIYVPLTVIKPIGLYYYDFEKFAAYKYRN